VPLGEWLLPVVTRELSAAGGCRVELSTLGLHAASTGAAAAVLGEVYAGTLALAVSAQLSTPSWPKVERRNCIGWPLSDRRVT